MKRTLALSALVVFIAIAVFGVPPFGGGPSAGFAEREPGFKTEVKRLPNGIYEVSALTPMPGVTPEMVRWWFADYMQTSEHYQRWYPGAHIWMDWENKVPGEYVGASHLVHEFIGKDMEKLRIQFVPPEDILSDVQLRESDVAICAKAGLLEQPINGGQMCHIIRATEDGAEMRSRFWLGMVAKREGNDQIASIEGLVANTYLARKLGVSDSAAIDLMNHCTEEMSILAEFLPELYAAETGAQ
ncbi:MAG: hypothetical protein AAGA89_02130 [Pseudomonadota bacterium]